MSVLGGPIKNVLRETTRPEAVTRMWHRIDARSRSRSRSLRASSRASYLFGVAAAAALAIVVAVAAFATWPSAVSPYAGPIRRHLGAPFTSARANDQDERILFDDQSVLALSRGGAVDVLANTPTEIVLKQLRGNAHYEVTPGGRRHWVIECGLVTVEVVGTSFTVERNDVHVRVDVQRGTVLVRGERLPGGVVRLTAGMNVDVSERSTAAQEAPNTPAPSTTTGSSGSSESSRSGVAPLAPTPLPPVPTPEWKVLARRGENAKAYAELGPKGISQVALRASVDDLFSLADVARQAGHPKDAVMALNRVLAEYPTDTRASVAAFTLGRIHLDSLDAPRQAAIEFQKAIDRGIPGGLAEDAFVRLAESCSKVGDVACAKRAHAAYLERFPSGPRESEFRSWVQDR